MRRHSAIGRRWWVWALAGGTVGGLAGLIAGTEPTATAQPTGLPKDKADFSKKFAHETHLALLTKDESRRYTCNDCHNLPEAEGKSEYPICKSPRMPFPGHDACISCHPTAFFVKPLKICTNCHQNIAITRKVALKEQSGAQAPLKTVFDHRLHLDKKMRVKKRFGYKKDCTHCHAFIRGGKKVRLPEHAQCCECHTKADVQPNINDCAGCHKRPKREVNPRSLVRKFSHADHKLDPATGQSLNCQRCHFDVPKSRKIFTLPLPKMATCVECHQGKLAFSYAECLRCHEKGIESALVPKSHEMLQKKAEQK